MYEKQIDHFLQNSAVRAILFKLLAHALQAPMRVNVTSERILTHPGIKVNSGNKSNAVPSHESPGISKFYL